MTNTLNKAISLIAALVMALVMMIPVSSAYAAGTGSITITPPAGTPSTATNTYKVYKVFDADGNGSAINYKLCSGDTLSDAMEAAGFAVDAAGNVTGPTGTELTQDAIAAIAAYVTDADLVATVTSTGTANAVAEGLANGYYYITTSTGTAVTINSTNPNATVNDKNKVPAVSKKITDVTAGSVSDEGQKAIAQAGSTVSYEADITVPANTKNLKFNDTMEASLDLSASSVTVTVNGTAVAAGDSTYTLTTSDSSFDIAFANAYVAGLADNAQIVITYNATVNSAALTADPAENTAKITYGDPSAQSGDTDNYVITSTTPAVYNATVTVAKSFQGLSEGSTLANNDSAQFVLKNADGKYYKIDGTTVSWVDQADATVLTYTQAGSQSFTGLADGTYTLVESKTPSGYKTAADQTITVANGTYTTANLEQTASITNNTGSLLPSTGDMGTTVLYLLGAALVIGAGVLLISRRKAQN